MKLAALSPETAEVAEHTPIQWIPGHLCFAQLAELPPELPPEEYAAFAELTLEGSSPFPVEQLCWGYWTDAERHQLLLVAVPRFRLEQAGLKLDEKAAHVFPGFLTAVTRVEAPVVVRFVEASGSMTALRLEKGKPLPQAVRSVPLPEEADETAYAFAREQALRALPGVADAQVEEGYWTVGLVTHSKDRGWHWTIRHGDDQQVVYPQWGAADWWTLDLRDAEAKTRLQREQRFAGYLTIAALAAAGTFILLLLLQLALFGLSAWNGARAAKEAEQMARVDTITQQQLLTERLQSSSRAGLRPFRMLELINMVRPPEVYFERVTSNGLDTIEITGKATAVGPVNNYVDLLRELPFITTATVEQTSETRGAEYRLKVTFSDVPNLADEQRSALASQP
ncbi:MAG: PilN domain-containing protein [Verrucomicrobiota bacterium JB022]|nr:PilN domain-containing protein [Verrucomicrobiota bacterium JB022]